jgi:hypothetical protein
MDSRQETRPLQHISSLGKGGKTSSFSPQYFVLLCRDDADLVSLIAELLRENKRMLDKSIREIERERQGLQTQEKKLISEIKKVAKQGQMVRAPPPSSMLASTC